MGRRTSQAADNMIEVIKMKLGRFRDIYNEKEANNIDLVIPCNNKGKKSLGLIFWLLTKGYMEARGMITKGGFTHSIDDFSEE